LAIPPIAGTYPKGYGWYEVRLALAEELESHESDYTSRFRGKTAFKRALLKIQVESKTGRVGLDKWMNRADCEQVIPNAYGRPLIFLGDSHVTYLPNRVPPQTKGDYWPIVLAFVDDNHWVAVELQEVDGKIPFPPYMKGWNKPHLTEPQALAWADGLADSFQLWTSLEEKETKDQSLAGEDMDCT